MRRGEVSAEFEAKVTVALLFAESDRQPLLPDRL